MPKHRHKQVVKHFQCISIAHTGYVVAHGTLVAVLTGNAHIFLRHFLHMVLLTYHRTRLLDKEISYAVFLGQRQLQKQYFAGVTPSDPALAAALEQGNYRKYLWLCETLWLRQ